MSRSGNPEENQHFEAVLNRLDALLRHDHAAEEASDTPSQDHVLPIKEEDDIPVLTDVYEGETSVLKDTGREVELPLFAESVEQPVQHPGAEDALVQPDAYFGSLATPLAEGSTQRHRVDGALVDYDAIVEKAVAALVLQVQEKMARTIEEETELALVQVQLKVIERMRDEIEAALRNRLQNMLTELGLNRNKTSGG